MEQMALDHRDRCARARDRHQRSADPQNSAHADNADEIDDGDHTVRAPSLSALSLAPSDRPTVEHDVYSASLTDITACQEFGLTWES